MKTSGASSVILLDEKTISSIEHFIGMAVRNEMPWDGLSSILENLALTVEKSRQIINILLQSLQSKQNGSKDSQNKQKQQSLRYAFIEKTESQNKSSKFDLKEVKTEVGNFNSSCHRCGEMFLNINDLKRHMKIHQESNETTKKLVERGEKLYTFIGDSDNLQGNEPTLTLEEVDHDDGKQIQIKPPTGKVNKEIYKCQSCNKVFNFRKNLSSHERIHKSQDTFECKNCKKRFNCLRYLRAHEKIHSSEIQFQCSSCKYKSRRKADLKRHEKIHTGERPFKCNTCLKSFSLSQALTIHIRTHT